MYDLRRNYSGFLVDSHISEHHPTFLSNLDPEDFVARVKQTGADSVMVYGCCCNGNCYYPTRMEGCREDRMKQLQQNYTGFLTDSHITEHDESHLSKLAPHEYVAQMRRTGADSVMVYGCCHNGNCYYPAKTGHMHRGLKGRDFYGETIALLKQNNIIPRAYYTVVYHRRAARENPTWRVCQVDGSQNYRRSWHCCPNAKAYREFAKAQIREICAYPIAAIFIDMTFWPGICVCPNCRERYLRESGQEIPTIVQWDSPKWVNFQRTRERWLSEFGHELTAAAKEVSPTIAVAHQFSPVLLGWMYGQSSDLAEAMDIPSGDFYGGKHQQRFGCKVLAAFEKSLPFEYMTSRCVTLYDHTSTKSDDEMLASCATTLAHGGTHMLIDAINPDGTLEKPFYDRIEKLLATMQPLKETLAELQPKLVADTGLYFSMKSHYRRDHNGATARDIMNPANNMLAFTDLRPVQETIGTSIVLNRARMPYRILTDRTSNFTGLNAIILNDASVLDETETTRLREFVREGGTLFATGCTSLYRPDASSTGDFSLADVFGVTFTGKLSKHCSYLAMPSGELIFDEVPAPLVQLTTAKQLAEVVEPLFERDDFEHFAAYHSNPPGKATGYPAMTVNQFGKGKCVYLYSSLLAKQQFSQQTFGERIFKEHFPSRLLLSCDAPPCVEVTLLRSPRQAKWLVCLVNYQDEAPSVPVRDLSLTVSLPGSQKAISARSVLSNRPLGLDRKENEISFRVDKLDTIEVIEVTMEGRS